MMGDKTPDILTKSFIEDYNLTHLREAAEDIAERFQVETASLQWGSEVRAGYDALHARLCPKIRQMLARSPERLMQLLYRIDVNEAKVKEAFDRFPGQDLAESLSALIIERQLQKMLLRQEAAAWLSPGDDAQEGPGSVKSDGLDSLLGGIADIADPGGVNHLGKKE